MSGVSVTLNVFPEEKLIVFNGPITIPETDILVLMYWTADMRADPEFDVRTILNSMAANKMGIKRVPQGYAYKNLDDLLLMIEACLPSLNFTNF